MTIHKNGRHRGCQVRRGGLQAYCALLFALAAATALCVGAGVGGAARKASTPSAKGNAIYVDASNADGPFLGTAVDPFRTIQQGIDTAAAGDEVVVMPGTYVENILLNGKDIVVTSQDPLDASVVAATIIDGNATYSVVSFSGAESAACVVNGFTIRNGKATYGGGFFGGVYSASSPGTHATIRNCVVRDNIAQGNFTGGVGSGHGGGFYQCDGLIENNYVVDNIAERQPSTTFFGYGGGLDCCDGVIRHNTIESNDSTHGAGLRDCNGTIFGNRIAENHATGEGAGMSGCDGVIQNNMIYWNWAEGNGGGLAWCDDAGTRIEHNTIFANSVSGGGLGGGIYQASGATITNCIVRGNVGLPELSSAVVPTYSCVSTSTTLGVGCITDDPGFVDPNNANFHLGGASACINAGTPVADLTTDFEGDARPFGLAYDIGADEFAPLYRITGTVTDARTGLPVEKALVVLVWNWNGNEIARTYTLLDGTFDIGAPDTTTLLRVRISKDGYDRTERGRIRSAATINVALAPAAPAPPTNVTAAAGAGGVLIQWGPSATADLERYAIYRCDLSLATPVYISAGEVGAGETRFTDETVVTGKSYRYRVTAKDSAGNESDPATSNNVQAGQITVWLPEVSSRAGQQVRIPISVTNATGIHPHGMAMDFRYPTSLVKLVLLSGTVISGVRVERTAITADMKLDVDYSTAGQVEISSTDLESAPALIGEGHLFDLIFTLRPTLASGTCGDLSFPAGGVSFYDESLALLPTDSSDLGQLCASTCSSCKDSPCIQGDLDYDGAITMADVTMALQIAAGVVAADACQLATDDFDGNGAIDCGDAILIQRMVGALAVNPSSSSTTLADTLDAEHPVAISAGAATGAPGALVEVGVSIDNAAGLSGFDLAVTFPPEVELQTVAAGSLTQTFERTYAAQAGMATISMSSDTALASGGGTIAVLGFAIANFAVPGTQFTIGIGEGDLKGQFADDFEWHTDVNVENGTITVSGATEPGDINSDGVVNALDVQLVINAALGLGGGYSADLNEDGAINALDVQLVINAALGL